MPQWVQSALFGAVTLASYFMGVIPSEGGFAALTVNQWLGAVVCLGAAFGIGQATRANDPHVVARTNGHGYQAGEASNLPTGQHVEADKTLDELASRDYDEPPT